MKIAKSNFQFFTTYKYVHILLLRTCIKCQRIYKRNIICLKKEKTWQIWNGMKIKWVLPSACDLRQTMKASTAAAPIFLCIFPNVWPIFRRFSWFSSADPIMSAECTQLLFPVFISINTTIWIEVHALDYVSITVVDTSMSFPSSCHSRARHIIESPTWNKAIEFQY